MACAFTGLGGRLAGLKEWIAELGPAAPLAFVLIRAGAAVAVIPGSPLSMAAGWLFGPVLGVACVSAGKTLGAAVAFLIARYFAREPVARWMARKERYRRLDDLVADYGVLVVAFNRLFPLIPFNVQNYAFGLTRVRFGTYLFWSWLCMLPGAVLVVMGMHVIVETVSRGEVPWAALGVLAATVLIMGALALYVFLKLLAKRRRRPGAGRRDG
ncbi:MAG: hypothetical protein AMK73_09925 [Planctomycetes bacterium SM23_32]|nr:MAG: hypothetical protein AMK73_09925 [Planctomycetes bacterium SM23_32]